MSKPRILLVEDDKNFGMILHDYLGLHHFDVTLKQDGEEGLEALKRNRYDLCIFDIMMPKKDGFTLAKEYKQLHMDTPFVFLTAKAIKEDMMSGYKLGADDYIIKPFDSELLLMKINAILKRHHTNKQDTPEIIQIGKSLLNKPQRLLTVAETKIKLSPKECALLCLLSEHRNHVMPRAKALTTIWQDDSYFAARSMDVYITKLRKYLQADSTVAINNLHGSGYMLQENIG